MVLKFGGSSLADADRIRSVAEIIESATQDDTIYVVVSAFGGITDLLIEATNYAESGDARYRHCLDVIFSRANTIKNDLLGDTVITEADRYIASLEDELRQLLYGVSLVREACKKTRDFVLSFGERISARFLSLCLASRHNISHYIDARDLIKTDDRYGAAQVNLELSYHLIHSTLKNESGIFIITGFIASDQTSGSTTTLGRGGSDYSAAIFAAALGVSELQIWTDVSGVMTCDPRKVPKAHTISKLNYNEAMELSHFGAKVLYAPTVRPVREKNIPTRIKNSFRPEDEGTLICADRQVKNNSITGISAIDNIALVCLQGPGLQGVTGTAARLFACLAEQDINVIMITQASSEHSICLAVEENVADRAKSHIENAFSYEIGRRLVEPVLIEKDMSLVAAVGENMRNQIGMAGSLFRILGRNGINIEAIAQGSSELNISFAVSSKDQVKALNAIHDSFFLSDQKTIHLFIVGTGLVGSTLLEIIRENAPKISGHNRLEIIINGISNSRKMRLSREGIEKADLAALQDSTNTKADIRQFIDFMVGCNFSNAIFIDNTSGPEIPRYYKEILASSIAISTPNKFALSGDIKEYKELKSTALKHGTSINFETNVGAGLPVISTLENLVKSGDHITKIEAVLSGSLSYIFNHFDAQCPFSEMILSAREKGFTEPDPREDLSGNDVKRKLLILARESGYDTHEENILISPLLDDELMSIQDTREFIEKLKEADTEFEQKYRKSEENQRRLRYIAQFENGQGHIGLKEIAKESPFYNLSGSDNMIAFYTNRYRHTPLIIRGPGAGAEVTAAGLLAEIINIGTKL